MNKFTKGAIATGAGVVLLLGGAGTLAYWNADAAVDAGSITAGTLTIESAAAGQWQDISSDVAGAPKNISTGTFLVVPGDTLRYTETFTVGATGTNLKANITANPGSIDTGDWGSAVTAATDIKIGGSTVSQITSANNGATVTVTVTLTFPFGTSADNTSQSAVVDLSDLEISLVQVR